MMGQLARQAMEGPACRAFQLLGDPCDVSHYLLLRVWEDRTTFAHFVRDAGLLWLDRAACSVAYQVLELLPLGAEDATPLREAVPVGAG